MRRALPFLVGFAAFAAPPKEPVEIGRTPQFFIDDHIVDNRWALKPKREEVVRVFHAPKKHERNPLIVGGCGYASAVRDGGTFKLWYQTNTRSTDEDKNAYGIAYAESKDGLTWTRPKLGVTEWQGSKDNNVVWRGHADSRASGQQILDLPESARRGFRYVMAYHTSGGKRGENGIHVVGSHDGIHWDKASDSQVLELSSDTVNSIVFDPARGEYAMFCRAKDRYLAGQEGMLDTGESRRISRIAGRDLWSKWEGSPQSILIPDELDLERGFNRFYGMTARVHAGITFGFVWSFKLNTDIWTELAWSRDGASFARLPARPRLIDLGPAGAWDDGMVFGSADWIEVGDDWWMYYAGWDGPHETRERKGSIGLATLRKEGFVSLHGPRGGGVVATRTLTWPGGDLVVNADASKGELKVRVSDERRKIVPGFDYADCETFAADSTAHAVKWRGASLDSLRGTVLRFEFQLRDADLYTFRAAQ
ncbi:MAG: hypothetical protein ABMA13_05945 [Chthoniobacteraceae bacterium]